MKIISVKKLQDQFLNKICTILTQGVAKTNFNDPQFSDFFTGIVEEINEDGLWLKHCLTGCKSFFFMQSIIGIIEEQVIEENDPRYNQIMEEIKKTPEKPISSPGVFDLDQMNSMIKQSNLVQEKINQN